MEKNDRTSADEHEVAPRASSRPSGGPVSGSWLVAAMPSPGATMVFARSGPLVALVHGRSNPSDREWSEYVAFARHELMVAPIHGLLVVSAGGGPNADQRQHILQVGKHRQMPVAVCTASLTARAIVRALRLFYRKPMIAFGADEVDFALAWLDAPRADALRLREFVRHAQRSLS